MFGGQGLGSIDLLWNWHSTLSLWLYQSFKVTAIKRLCVAKLPPYLTIQLKRFDFDWERDIPQKYNDYFEFPLEFDMMPYTAQGLAQAEGISFLNYFAWCFESFWPAYVLFIVLDLCALWVVACKIFRLVFRFLIMSKLKIFLVHSNLKVFNGSVIFFSVCRFLRLFWL